MNDDNIEKKKQYLMMVDDTSVAMLSRLMPSLLFVEVHGMFPKDTQDYQFLVNPMPKQNAIEPSESMESVVE